MKWLLMAAVFAPAVAASGAAQGQPLLIPGRDVSVLYRLGGAAADQIPGGAPDGVRLLWDAAGQRLRAEPVGRPMYALTDLQRRVADIVFAAQNSYIEARIKGGDPQTLLAGRDVRFARIGEQHLLGMACTNWAIHSQKIDGTGCVTADGVILKAEGTIDGQPGRVTAESVSYGKLPDSDFVPPDGYARLALPGVK
jgi:hypothetical protein